MTNFEKLAQSPAEFGAFLRGLPILEGPWDDEFHKRYCRKCSSTDCTYCPHEKFRKEDFEAEEQRLRKERREALQDWVGTNGVEAYRAEVEKIWNGA